MIWSSYSLSLVNSRRKSNAQVLISEIRQSIWRLKTDDTFAAVPNLEVFCSLDAPAERRSK
jgi:hypothetical protein